MNLKAFHRNNEVIYTMSSLTLNLDDVDYYSTLATGETRLYFMHFPTGIVFVGWYGDMADFRSVTSVTPSQKSLFIISCGANIVEVRL